MRYWFDTEFIERGPAHPIRLLSIGIVAEDGREYYYEKSDARHLVNQDHAQFGDRWLIDNVRPHLWDGASSPWHDKDPAVEIVTFCNQGLYGKPEFWAYYADYDWVVLCQIFGRMIDLPSGWPMYCRDLKQYADEHGGIELPRQLTPEHHALNNARWTKESWDYATRIAAVQRS